MTIEERVSRLEQRADNLAALNERVERIEVILTRILATLDSHETRLGHIEDTLHEIAATLPRLGFRWPWERRMA